MACEEVVKWVIKKENSQKKPKELMTLVRKKDKFNSFQWTTQSYTIGWRNTVYHMYRIHRQHRVIYIGLEGVTLGYTRLHGYTWLQGVTWGYTGLHPATQGYMGLHRATWGYTG